MSSHNEQVQPAAFDVAAPTSPELPTSSEEHAQPHRPSWMVPALLGLGVLAALVIFWLPGRVDPSTAKPVAVPDPAAQTASAQSKPNQPSAPTSPEASPWSDAQMAKMRKEAQDVLANLLEVQGLLEDTAVELWDGAAFEQATALATAGDSQYRERQFDQAKGSYQQALAAMEAILERTDDALEGQLERGRAAIEAGEPKLAEEALAVATAIEPGNPDLAELTARLASLEQLQSLLNQATEAEQTGNLEAAENLLKEATTLDPQHLRARSELTRVAAAHTQMRFNDAMSDGYLALDGSEFDRARTAFKRAAKFLPGSTEAASALQEVQAAKTASRLSRLQTRGKASEAGEQWQDAFEAYEQALEIDPNIQYAQQGFKRTRTRAKLDSQFSSAIKAPERLADPAIAEATATLLRQAATITPRGPVLEGQITQLQELLVKANKALTLTLQSDGETEVIVYKVARLGLFEQRQLQLRPGKYTAVGTRNGYRDVRVSFNLSHEGPLPSVIISCTEKI
jgi:tetratricopeptide (TPR) repeat protein